MYICVCLGEGGMALLCKTKYKLKREDYWDKPYAFGLYEEVYIVEVVMDILKYFYQK